VGVVAIVETFFFGKSICLTSGLTTKYAAETAERKKRH
jgi:hypothetical protein